MWNPATLGISTCIVRKWAFALITGATLCACVPFHNQGATGRAVESALVSTLAVGSSTYQEIMVLLGPPVLSQEDKRAIAYEAEGLSVFLVSDMGTGVVPLTQKMLFIQFDESDIVTRLEEIDVGEGTIFTPEEVLANWAAGRDNWDLVWGQTVVATENDDQPWEESQRSVDITVDVKDLRVNKIHQRTAAFGVPMGTITLSKKEPDMIRELILASANRIIDPQKADEIAHFPIIECEIRDFTISTPATILYWDVEVGIEIGLRMGDEERLLSGGGQERTWIWPSDSIVSLAMGRALEELRTALDIALAEMLANASGAESMNIPAGVTREISRSGLVIH